MGPQLVAKSVLLIWNNLWAALRATAVPVALSFVVAALLAGAFGGGAEALRSGAADGVAVLGGFLAFVVVVLGYAWAAVAWHRYVLLEEEPGVLPRPPKDRVLAYVGAALRLIGPMILVGVLVAVAGLGLLGLVAGFGEGGAALAGLVAVGLSFAVFYAVLRFSLHLPAAAVGHYMGAFESWAVTAPAKNAILTAAILLSLLQGVLGVVASALNLAGVAGLLLALIVNWFSTVLGLSILTALYGHIVEKRPLD